ncbi:MAG: DMT family transporter, partial [Deltaproteobacteria bacterium]|nr:DMT family transporter [Deltaproteobacteria bacterium]
FVAQRAGMDNLGPFVFTGVRFSLGAALLWPLVWVRRHKPPPDFLWAAGRRWRVYCGALLAGLVMFVGINLQQMGLVYTTAGKAGFITGLYVVMVPLLGLMWGRQTNLGCWLGIAMGTIGLYLLSVTEQFTLARGDGLVLACAVVWAAHVWMVGWLSPKIDACFLACGQAVVCAILSLITAVILGESFSVISIQAALIPILWGGGMSVALGFTLQIIGQQHSPPAHAAIIMALESVFAALAGWLILGEAMTNRGMFGAGLMLAGTLVAQMWISPGLKRKIEGKRQKTAAGLQVDSKL